ncbi:hypothetical protein N9N67_11280, partial [Bacteriovoracaceae bacterium]|nr:hypothetical protein [Bacteriovoracaceae bacterium]
YVLYWTIFSHPGPKPGKNVGTIPWVGHRFFVSSIPFKRSEIVDENNFDKDKFTKVNYSFWTKDGKFELNNSLYRLDVFEDENSNNVKFARDKKNQPIRIFIERLKNDG